MTEPAKNMYGMMVLKDPSKYPARMGLTWKDDEIVKLLTEVRKKKTISEIAEEHQRTTGSISGQLRKLAGDYYYNDKRSIEEIQKFTGLSKEQVDDVIKKRAIKENMTESIKKSVLKQEEIKKNENAEIMIMLKDINKKLDLLLQIS